MGSLHCYYQPASACICCGEGLWQGRAGSQHLGAVFSSKPQSCNPCKAGWHHYTCSHISCPCWAPLCAPCLHNRTSRVYEALLPTTEAYFAQRDKGIQVLDEHPHHAVKARQEQNSRPCIEGLLLEPGFHISLPWRYSVCHCCWRQTSYLLVLLSQ